jgi:hypothetical protein
MPDIVPALVFLDQQRDELGESYLLRRGTGKRVNRSISAMSRSITAIFSTSARSVAANVRRMSSREFHRAAFAASSDTCAA